MREVIDQEDLWTLRRTDAPSRWQSWITHDCPITQMEKVNPGWSKTHYASCTTSMTCPICYKKVPERLRALWTLHNFDAIAEVPSA